MSSHVPTTVGLQNYDQSRPHHPQWAHNIMTNHAPTKVGSHHYEQSRLHHSGLTTLWPIKSLWPIGFPPQWADNMPNHAHPTVGQNMTYHAPTTVGSQHDQSCPTTWFHIMINQWPQHGLTNDHTSNNIIGEYLYVSDVCTRLLFYVIRCLSGARVWYYCSDKFCKMIIPFRRVRGGGRGGAVRGAAILRAQHDREGCGQERAVRDDWAPQEGLPHRTPAPPSTV